MVQWAHSQVPQMSHPDHAQQPAKPKLYPFNGGAHCDEEGHERAPMISSGPTHLICYICHLESLVDKLECKLAAQQPAAPGEEARMLVALGTAICGAWAKGCYQGCIDGASQPTQTEMEAIIKVSLEVAGQPRERAEGEK
jgi:hypothetical protein